MKLIISPASAGGIINANHYSIKIEELKPQLKASGSGGTIFADRETVEKTSFGIIHYYINEQLYLSEP